MTNELTTALGEVTTAMSSQINVATIGGMFAAVISAGLGLYVAWVAMRKVFGATKGALKGKFRV